jgi:AbrB family looped-hinge helix DNA binding protein
VARAKIGQRFTVVLPKETRAGLDVDDPVEVVRREDGVIEIRPMMLVEKSQAWFWTPTWQEREREVDADYAAGRFRVHDSTDDFLAALDRGGPEDTAGGSTRRG